MDKTCGDAHVDGGLAQRRDPAVEALRRRSSKMHFPLQEHHSSELLISSSRFCSWDSGIVWGRRTFVVVRQGSCHDLRRRQWVGKVRMVVASLVRDDEHDGLAQEDGDVHEDDEESRSGVHLSSVPSTPVQSTTLSSAQLNFTCTERTTKDQ